MFGFAGVLDGKIRSTRIEDDDGDVVGTMPLIAREFERFASFRDIGDRLIGFCAIEPFAFDDTSVSEQVSSIPIRPRCQNPYQCEDGGC